MSDDPTRPVVIDSSCLSSFARAERLDDLRRLLADHPALMVRAVALELKRGQRDHPTLEAITSADWLRETSSEDSLETLQFFAEYVRLLGSGSRDLGEAATLAWAQAHQAIAVIDERAGANQGRARGVEVVGSLGLIASGVRRGLLDGDAAAELVGDLQKHGGAWFPCSGADFVVWATGQGLL